MQPNDRHSHDEDLGLLRNAIEAVQGGRPAPGEAEAAGRRLIDALEQREKGNWIMETIRNSTRTKTRWATATALILTVAVLAVMFANTGGSGAAYARAVEQLRLARTVQFLVHLTTESGVLPMEAKIAFREPGLQRSEMTMEGVNQMQILDTVQNRGVILMPDMKMCIKMDLTDAPDNERERLGLMKLLYEDLDTLPAQAEEIETARTIDGVTAKGYRAGDREIWIDPAAKKVLRIERPSGAGRMIMTGFELDPPELTDAMFSADPPEGYSIMNEKPVTLDNGKPGESDVAAYLGMSSSMIKGHVFPPSINPMSIMRLQKEGKLLEDSFASPEDEQAFIQNFTQACRKSMMFAMGLKPENQWNYAGSGVAFGQPGTPIAWYKSDGAEGWRVIWADLTITDEPPEFFDGR